MAEVAQYIKFMNGYCDFYDELVKVWEDKEEILAHNRLHLMDEQAKRENVVMLQARGWEDKRIKLQAQMDWEHKSLREVIELTEGVERQQLCTIKTRLTASVQALQAINHACEIVVNERLKVIDGEIEKINMTESAKNKKSKLINRTI